MKKVLPFALIGLMLLGGLGLLFYPDIAHYLNDRNMSGLIQEFHEEVRGLTEDEIAEQFRLAEAYNESLTGFAIEDPFVPNSGAVIAPAAYLAALSTGNMMARLQIPSREIDLPVFHTTASAVLDRGVGHIEATSLPIGGSSTHAVLTGHSGLTYHQMFNGLLDMETGEQFFITVLDRTLAYQVDQILTVLPHQVESLQIYPGEDFVTLITCTPYAINTHRLLVRGTRIPYEPGMVEEIEPEAEREIDWRLVVIIVIALLFLLIFIIIWIRMNANKRRRLRARDTGWGGAR